MSNHPGGGDLAAYPPAPSKVNAEVEELIENLPTTPPRRGNAWAGQSEADRLLAEYVRTRDVRLRNRLALMNDGLACYLASRFQESSGCARADLIQVARMGLISAIERFDPEVGCSLTTFAVPTVLGALKRYLRDHAWLLAVPRRLREFGIRMCGVRERLEMQLQRCPTISELAVAAQCTEEQIVEALDLELTYGVASLDAPGDRSEADGPQSMWEGLGACDSGLEVVVERESFRTALAQLEERERTVIYRRFYHDDSQSAVAARLRVSQMHVSRLERRALLQLRSIMNSTGE